MHANSFPSGTPTHALNHTAEEQPSKRARLDEGLAAVAAADPAAATNTTMQQGDTTFNTNTNMNTTTSNDTIPPPAVIVTPASAPASGAPAASSATPLPVAAPAAASAAAAATTTTDVAAATPAPPPVPLSPLLTHTRPSWMTEVPSFLEAIQQHEPTIPDEVVQYLLERSGCNVTDPKLIRLVSIATQHFLSDVLHDARQYHKLRSKEKTTSSELTLPDLSSALSAHGVQLSKADYFADSVFAGGMLNVNAAVQSTQNNVQAASAGKADAKKDAARKK